MESCHLPRRTAIVFNLGPGPLRGRTATMRILGTGGRQRFIIHGRHVGRKKTGGACNEFSSNGAVGIPMPRTVPAPHVAGRQANQVNNGMQPAPIAMTKIECDFEPARSFARRTEKHPSTATASSPVSRYAPVWLVWGLLLLSGLSQTYAAFQTLPLRSAPTKASDEPMIGPPRGQFRSQRVPFDVVGPVRLTGLQDAREGQFHPTALTNLTVDRRFTVLHLLHGLAGNERDGTPYASVVFRYADGQQDVIRLAYGLQARGLNPGREETVTTLHDPNSFVAWQGKNTSNGGQAANRIYHSVLANPRPDVKVTAIDILSLFSRATPLVFAATAEDAPEVGALPELPENRVVRRSREFPDDTYRSSLNIEAVDADGRPVPGAEATLTISDLEGAYYFGRDQSDANGRIRLPFPPQHAAGCTVVVRTPHRLPFVFRSTGTGVEPSAREIKATLASGTSAGGLVRNAAGAPIPDASVTLYELRAISSREYERLDYETVNTDAAGKWKSAALPAALEQFQIAISHPDFRPRVFRVGPRDPSLANAMLPPDELRAGDAAAILEPAQRIAGVVRGPDEKPVAGAELRLSGPTSGSRGSTDAGDEQVVRTDGNGRYKLSVLAAGNYSLIVVANGYTPELRSVTVPARPGAVISQDIALQAGHRLLGRVNDQDQRPVAGAHIRLDSWNDNRLVKFETDTDDQGTFVWTNAPSGQMRFQLSATNHSSTTYSISVTPSGPESQHQFTLRRFSAVRGLVTDVETGKPIPDFMIFRGRAYNQGEPIRWERYNTFRGRNGDYNVRLVEYSSGTRTAILIEAPGYLPVASPEFTRAGLYTNNFAMKKARGIHGRILAADGSPVAGAAAVLVELSDYAYLRATGEFSRSSDGGPQVRTDLKGEFEFPARLAPHTIIATHDRGFAEVRLSNSTDAVTVTLQPWARITGTVKLPMRNGQAHTVQLGNTFYRYADDSRESQPLSLYLSVEADSDGRFAFNRVPPGDRTISIRHSVQIGDNTRSANSHPHPLQLNPGASTNLVIGDGGRRVTGRMKVNGGEPEDVDWRRDFHTLTLQRTLEMNLRPLDFSNAKTDEQRQALWAEQRKQEAAFWRSPPGRAWERSQRTYVLEFETNGTFRVDGVPPGNYTLSVNPTDPTREDYSYDQIGNLSRAVSVPEADPGEVGKPVELGEIEIAIRATMRVGKRAPRFSVTGFDGKEITLDQLRGKPVLLDLWATWHGGRSFDLRQLKLLHDRFGKSNRLHMLGISLDASRELAEGELKKDPLPWPQAYGGNWNESALRQIFGLRSLPEYILIDAEGRIAAFGLRGTAITRAVERLMSNPTAAPVP